MLDNLDSFVSGSGETEEPISSSFKSNLTLSVTLPGNETETLFPDLIPFNSPSIAAMCLQTYLLAKATSVFTL